MASTAFQKAMDKRPGAKKLMQTAKDAEKNTNFEPPEVPDGVYVLRVKATCGITPNKNIPYVEFKWTIAPGQGVNGGYNKTYYFNEDATPEDEEKTYTRLGKDFKTLLSTDVLNMESLGEIANLVEQVDNLCPFVRSKITTNIKGEKTYINVFFNQVVDAPSNSDSGNVTDASPAGDTSSSDVVEVRKNAPVIYDAKKYKVLTSNPMRQTCTLVAEDGDRKQDIPWDAVEVLSV